MKNKKTKMVKYIIERAVNGDLKAIELLLEILCGKENKVI